MLDPNEPGLSSAAHNFRLALGGSGGSTQTAQMASTRVKAMLNHLASDKASQMLADAITDPELFKALLTQLGKPNLVERKIPHFIPYLVGGSTAAVHQESAQ